MELKNSEAKHYTMTRNINTLLLCTHICFLGLFLYFKVNIMVYVNIGSVLIYTSLFFYYKRSVVRYVAIVMVEILVHMSLATICVGWNAGYQFYYFCLLPCIFLCDYLAKTDHKKGMHPIAVSVIVMIVFLMCRRYCVSNKSIYDLSDNIESMMFVNNMIASFAFLIIYLVIFERQILKKEKQLENMAEIDELTKLPNRHLMQEWLKEGFASSKQGMPMAIAMLDVDDFKKLNDVYGHNSGDMVLTFIASKIEQHSENTMRIARWGGEEFLFLDFREDALQHLLNNLEELRKDVESDCLQIENEKIRVTFTAGITSYDKRDRTVFDTINRADECMYKGKEGGKNRIISG